MKLTILGCAGGIGGRERLTTSLLLDGDVLLDAGTGLGSLDVEQLVRIDHVFLTHSHLDHVAGLAFLIDAVQTRRTKPLVVHASETVVAVLKKSLFNWVLWPDFGAIPNAENPVLVWQPLPESGTVELGARRLQAYPVNHMAGSVAYAVEGGGDGFLFTGDMGATPQLWPRLAAHPNIKDVIVDCSFVNADRRIAELSLHFCPQTLLEDIVEVSDAVRFLIYHLKPGFEGQIMQQLEQNPQGRSFRALQCGDTFIY